MCKAVEEYTLKTKVLALIDYLAGEGIAKEEIIQKITNKYPVTAEYVEELMAAYAKASCIPSAPQVAGRAEGFFSGGTPDSLHPLRK